jgi:hypothetical protein
LWRAVAATDNDDDVTDDDDDDPATRARFAAAPSCLLAAPWGVVARAGCTAADCATAWTAGCSPPVDADADGRLTILTARWWLLALVVSVANGVWSGASVPTEQAARALTALPLASGGGGSPCTPGISALWAATRVAVSPRRSADAGVRKGAAVSISSVLLLWATVVLLLPLRGDDGRELT